VSEQFTNDLPPKYAIRLENLRAWHIVTAWCVACDRRVVLTHQALWRGRSRNTRLVDLEARLRCTSCGSRKGHRIDIGMAPRN
jgi:hypothetical protein